MTFQRLGGHRFLGVLCAAAIATASVSVAAQSPPAAAAAESPDEVPPDAPDHTPSGGSPPAEASIDQRKASNEALLAGRRALASKARGPALGHLREAYGIVADPKTRLLIVRVLREMGRLGQAFSEAQAVMAAAEGDPRQANNVRAAKKELSKLEGKVGFVKLANPPGEGSAIWVNQRPIEAASWSKPIAVTAGEVRVVVDDAEPTVVTVEAGKEVPVTVAEPEADKEAAAEAKANAVAAASSGGGGYSGPDRKLMALGAGSVGVIGMSLFGAFGAISQGQADRLEDACDGDICDPALETVRDRGETTQTVANAMLGIGIVGLAAGAGLFVWDLVDPAADSTEMGRAPTFQPKLVVGPSSVSIRGTF